MKSPKTGQVSGINNFEAIVSISLLLNHPCCVTVPSTMRKVYAGPWKIQKKVQTQLKTQGAIHIRNDNRMAYNYALSCMKAECAVACLERLTGGLGWKSFIKEAELELGMEGFT